MIIEDKRENHQWVPFTELSYGDCFSMDEDTDFLAIKVKPIKGCNAVKLYDGDTFVVNQDEEVLPFSDAKIVIE